MLALGAGMVLSGCATESTAGSSPDSVATTTPIPSTSASQLVASGSPTCQVSCGENPQYNGPANLPAPSWSPGDEEAALAASKDTMIAYMTPGTDHTVWFENIRPRITDQFAIELGKFNPSYLTVSKMTGDPTIATDPSNPFQAVVTVPTDDGEYKVTMLRSTQTAFWLANSIVPQLRAQN